MAQSLLATDGYKFSMAEAGWPLRTETFYYSHRKGGPQVLPVDVPAFVRSLLPRRADDDYRYLAEHSYEMGSGFKAAIVQTDALEIRALPRGAVLYDREPVFTVTGPSALVSWLDDSLPSGIERGIPAVLGAAIVALAWWSSRARQRAATRQI